MANKIIRGTIDGMGNGGFIACFPIILCYNEGTGRLTGDGSILIIIALPITITLIIPCTITGGIIGSIVGMVKPPEVYIPLYQNIGECRGYDAVTGLTAREKEKKKDYL
jgi:hypothetical protein